MLPILFEVDILKKYLFYFQEYNIDTAAANAKFCVHLGTVFLIRHFLKYEFFAA